MAKLLSSVSPKDGFHPTSTTKICLDDMELLSKSNCSLHLYYALPPLIFVDPYELAHHEDFYTFRHWGISNLELPISALPRISSSVLLDVKIPKNTAEFEVQLPLHLRYGDPAKASTKIPRSSSRPPRMPTEVSSLFDTSSASFIPISLIGTNYSESVSVPTGNPADLDYVEGGTTLTILLAFLVLFRATWRTADRIARSSRPKTD
ncbi:Protein pbn1 [Hypsizygus marmoreus]|uniref:Protein PBN1 n=1 Tax=Hypsizygus marmoreus TaxID=39966 RepID=A0A369JW21_HYPMA|nr:Protein pbn1 [Hypsizygus marmoreus]